MNEQRSSETIAGASKHPRTIALRKQNDGILERLGSGYEKLSGFISGHTPRFVKLAIKRMTQPKVLAAFAIILVTLFAIGAYYYVKLAKEIDARLAGAFFDNSVGIFTSPFKVSVGDKLSVDDLVGYLKGAGYSQKESAGENDPTGSFSIINNSVEVRPGQTARIEFGLSPVAISVNPEGRVASIINRVSGKSISSTSLEGELLAGVVNGDRHKKTPVAYADIPVTLRNAVIAVEDRRFFSHNGIDWRGIMRALWEDANHGGIVQGGSTITQQLIKNAFLSSDRTFSRKIKEAAMAVILESRLSKEEIFTLYANNVYLGHVGSFAVHGFAQAAEVYFGKTLDKLTLAESAFLAGLIHAPNRYGVGDEMARAVERRNIVLDSMVETGAISSEQSEASKGEPIALKKREAVNDYGASYFVDYVQKFLDERYGNEGLGQRKRIYTTMDPRLQRAAYEAVTKRTESLDKVFSRSAKKGQGTQPVQAAIVALDAHTGEILAMVGGRDYSETQLNRATQSKRQPGSTFKPFVYAHALSSRSYTLASVLSDSPQTFTYDGGREEYKPANFHNGYTNREVTLREAMSRSLNVPTVELAMKAGLGGVARLAEDCGLERPRAYPSMALGTSEVTPLQLAGAYTAFANNGTALRPTPVKAMQDAETNSLTQKVSASSSQVFSPQVAYLMTSLMQSVVSSGTAASLRSMGLDSAIAGKTGTTNDAWFVGYTPNMVCVVWVGFDDNRDLKMQASDVALPIWADFVKEALAIHPEYGGESFSRPGGIVTVEIDPTTGFIASAECSERRQEVFVSGTEPFAVCSHFDFSDQYLTADYNDYSTSFYEQAKSSSRIEVSLCAQTGLLASPSCGQVMRKTYDMGEEPWRTCWGEGHKEPAEDWRAGGGAEIVERSGREAPDDPLMKPQKKKKAY